MRGEYPANSTMVSTPEYYMLRRRWFKASYSRYKYVLFFSRIMDTLVNRKEGDIMHIIKKNIYTTDIDKLERFIQLYEDLFIRINDRLYKIVSDSYPKDSFDRIGITFYIKDTDWENIQKSNAIITTKIFKVNVFNGDGIMAAVSCPIRLRNQFIED